MNLQPTLIISDLDGTLLHHDTYELGPAEELVRDLGEKGVPVILNTSKTRAEVSDWLVLLNLDTPFVIENGSAIFFPRKDFARECLKGFDPQIDNRWWRVNLGTPLATLLPDVQPIIRSFKNLVTCSLGEAVAMTGLSSHQALSCQRRHWSIPVFVGNDEALGEIKVEVEALGYSCVSGGRFAHIQGVCDKGLASKVIKDAYESRDGVAYRVIALGDSENDRMMLEQASTAVVVRSKGRAMTLTRKDAITTELEAPQGWIEGLERAFGGDEFG